MRISIQNIIIHFLRRTKDVEGIISFLLSLKKKDICLRVIFQSSDKFCVIASEVDMSILKQMHRYWIVVCLLNIELVWKGVLGANFTTPCWHPIEIELQSATNYSNPYTDVNDFTGTFVSPTGVSMIMPGFWDGGQTWRLRFAPNLVGIWTYRTNGSDPNLNQQTGYIQCTPYSGSLAIYQHGFIKAKPNDRYLIYDDGTPFYWLGDTHWSGFSIAERLNQSNDARFISMFKGLVDRRVEQGFTVWKAETFANNNEQGNPPANEGGPAWNNNQFFINLNPAFWQNIDERMNYLSSKGMVVSFAQGIGRSMKDASVEFDHKRLARYILARYGAYPTVWITAQEYDDTYAGACGPCWANVSAYTYDLDPYKRANSMHNAATNRIAYHDQTWYGFVTLQQAHNRVNSFTYWLEQYNAVPARPILEDEANYEDIIPSYGGGTVTPKWKTRQSAWQSQIAGTFGFTYGAQGIWWGCYTTQDPNGNCGSGSDARAWNTAIDFPVGEQMSFMAKFWTSFQWWTLSPDQSSILWNSAPSDTQQPFQKSDGNNRGLIVAYLPLQLNGHVYNGTVRNLSPTGIYTSQWFDPRQGTFTMISQGWSPTQDGLWNIPTQPTADDDWILLIERINGSNTSPNAALGMNTNTSSYWDINQTSNKSVDGDLGTDWQASSQQGFDNSWLVVDFGTKITFNKIRIFEYNQRTRGYRIEYWNETIWTIAYTGTTISTDGVQFPTVISNQLRVVFTAGTEFSPIVYELEVYHITSKDFQ